MPKPLNIAMLGCGFMGRAHSNGWLQVNHFFPREHQPVLRACYGLEEDRPKLEDFAKKWGYEDIETDWRKIITRGINAANDACRPTTAPQRDVIGYLGLRDVSYNGVAVSFDNAAETTAFVQQVKSRCEEITNICKFSCP